MASNAISLLTRLLENASLLKPKHKPSHLLSSSSSSILAHLNSTSSPPSTFHLNRAIESLAACGRISDAHDLFDQMPHRDGGSWNAIITACVRNERPRDAISLFRQMHGEGILPKDVTFASVLSCCADLLELSLARQIHGLILKLAFSSNVIIGTSLVDVYGKCDIVDEARKLFDLMPHPNAISWNVIIRRYLEAGRGDEAVAMFFRMIGAGIRPLSFTVSNTFLACSDIFALKEGCQIHGFVVKIGYECHVLVRKSLLEMYAKCGAIDDAHRLFNLSETKDVFLCTSMVSAYATCGRIGDAELLFEEMSDRNIVSWNAMLAGYARSACWEKAMNLFQRMRRETEEIDILTLGSVLNICAGLFDLETGKQVHGFAYRNGFHLNLFLMNALLAMYAKCGCLRNAEIMFFRMDSQRDRFSWNSLILGYERHCRSEKALAALREMLRETTPNESTFSSGLAACANIFMLDHGKQIHAYMIRKRFEIDDIIRAALVDMYSKCRLIDYSVKVFEQKKSSDVVLWNSMILGCAYNGRGEYGLEIFEEMQKHEIRPDNVTFLGALLACISEGYVNLGQRYFILMSEEYHVVPRLEHYECMIELFGKHGFMVELENFVESMPFEPTTAMWTRIFDSCREYGNRKLGKRAERCINETNPLNPVRFEVIPERDSVPTDSIDCS
ncbi:pentatricopeptide repeat-containing protein At3g26540 [Typha latifolia]|uniref:pentatricopeptide repeat-containing protein At3g26540 n=1 Tax=Typha latifolia TaxID=4733 RepID=UPI003C2BBD67